MAGNSFGPYRLDGLLGRGDMGEVYRAHDTRKDDRLVALKLLPEQLSRDDGYRARFRQEAKVAALLREPHVIPVHDFGEIDGRLYLEMRLVDGVDLETLLRRDGPLSPHRAVSIIEQLAAALDAAHAQGLIHRDVTPSSVLVTPGPPEFVQVVDFGIAHDPGTGVDHRPTRTGLAAGSAGYMAPERALSQRVGRPADIYAVACILFALLAGRRPFVGDDAAVVHSHLYQPVPAVSTFRADVPPALDHVIAVGAAKRPELRYATAGALAAAARSALAAPFPAVRDTRSTGVPAFGDPPWAVSPTAAPPGPPRRRTLPVVVAGVVAALLLLGGVAANHVFSSTPAPAPAVASAGPVGEGDEGDDGAGIAAPDAVGTWSGTYECAQGQTGLILTVEAADDDALSATFEFFPVRANPGVPSGRFSMKGLQEGRDVRLRQYAWVERPPGFQMVDLSGAISSDGSTFEGAVLATTGCTTFTLRRP